MYELFHKSIENALAAQIEEGGWRSITFELVSRSGSVT